MAKDVIFQNSIEAKAFVSQWAKTRRETMRADGRGTIPFASGTWFTVANSTAVGANDLTSIPFVVEEAQKWTRLAVRVTNGAAAAARCRFGIYDADPVNGSPRNLLLDSGELQATANNTEFAVTPADFTLLPGRYFFALLTNAALNFWGVPQGNLLYVYGFTSTAQSNPPSRLNRPATPYGPLPAAYPSGSNVANGSGYTAPGLLVFTETPTP